MSKEKENKELDKEIEMLETIYNEMGDEIANKEFMISHINYLKNKRKGEDI